MNGPIHFVLIALTFLVGAAPAALAQPEVGQVVFQADFEGDRGLAGWAAFGQDAGRRERAASGSQCLFVEQPTTEGAGARSFRAELPLDKLRGTRVRVEARVRAENVAKPPNAWNGVKVMLHTNGPAGQTWQQQNSVFGTFDWKSVVFTAEVPDDATEAWIILGLEQTSGRAWFDDLTVTTIAMRRRSPEAKPTGPVYKGHDLPRLRGAMISTNASEADLRVLGGQWKANHVRWQLTWGGFPRSPADNVGVDEYRRWLDSVLEHMDGLLPVCREVGIHVVVDLHTPPGGRDDSNECRMFKERRFQEAFVEIWEMIAKRYRDNPTVWGYDLVNEPLEGVVGEGLMDWHALVTRTAKRVRAIDPDHAIIIEPGPWGSPASLQWFEPLDVPGVVYSVHMYQPHQFTHQGVHGGSEDIVYPGEIDGKQWDRDALRRALQPAIDYQRDYGVHIYLGEFSAIRWAPGDSAHDYLRDCIEIFEENQWDWAYHAFREWDGWSVEHGADRKDRSPSAIPTPREKLLRGWFEKNERTD